MFLQIPQESGFIEGNIQELRPDVSGTFSDVCKSDEPKWMVKCIVLCPNSGDGRSMYICGWKCCVLGHILLRCSRKGNVDRPTLQFVLVAIITDTST